MPSVSHKIVVAGDVTVDWLEAVIPAVSQDVKRPKSPQNWQLQAGTHMVARPGGALLLAQMVQRAVPKWKILTHDLASLENIPPDEVIHSIVELGRFPASSDDREGKKVYRVKKMRGFSGPLGRAVSPLPVTGDDPDAAIVVIDDAGNGFRDVKSCWPAALRTSGKRPLVIYKMSRPLAEGALWQMVRERHADRLLVVLNADDLREASVNISRRLSWERTAKDFVTASVNHHVMLELTAVCNDLVACFGLDGAIHLSRRDRRVGGRSDKVVKYSLYYDPALAEDGFQEWCEGNMLGFNSAFVAAITARVAGRKGFERVGEGVRAGLHSARRLLQHGFGEKVAELNYPVGAIFSKGKREKDAYVAETVVPPAGQDFWCILEALDSGRRKATRSDGEKDAAGVFKIIRYEKVATDIIERGEAQALKDIPTGRFGSLTFVDRNEIESFRTIENLIREYLRNPRPKRPLSIAVFGPPGSGKSVGVTEVAKSIAAGQVVELPFNVAQFSSPGDLVSAFHKVRNVALRGMTPLVFFDEFDSDKLGWLKYFLAPMQDGEFKDGETMHPIGKAIFVFAGGTCGSYEEFYKKGADEAKDSPPEGKAEATAKSKEQEFKDVKGPDFLSRLRGYVNILGPNPIGGDPSKDPFFPIRRAMALRWQLKRKAEHLFNGNKVEIDRGVLRALLRIPEYKHGLRSLEAILDMSQLSRYKTFQQAALPPPAQIELHVDAEMFWQLVKENIFPQDVQLDPVAEEELARAFHEKYCKVQRKNLPSSDPAMRGWDDLPEKYKKLNRLQAKRIKEELWRIGYNFRKVGGGRGPAKVRLRKEEIEALAKMEHNGWMEEKLLDGWRLGPRDYDEKTNPYLVKWEKLPEKIKELNRDVATAIPEMMADIGFELKKVV